ncbi:MAG: nucleotidyltransferase domain-containing protein [Candidatus Aenigmatarchaeota archaeon]
MKEILKRHKEILVAHLYGSTAKGNGTRDIDIGLALEENLGSDALYTARIAKEIENKTSLKNVDVRILNNCSLRFLNQVLRYGHVIFSRDEKAGCLLRHGLQTDISISNPFIMNMMLKEERGC